MSNKFLATNTNTTLNNGSTPIFASSLGSANLDPSMPIKTNSTRQLVSEYLSISDVNTLQSTLNSKASKISTDIIEAAGYRINGGGSSSQYLTSDGGVGYPSGSGSSNIYFYDSSTNLTLTPTVGQIRYNNVVQADATQIAISHLTRDNLDIDAFLTLVDKNNIIYIQDQNTSLNYIKYSISNPIIIAPNNFYLFNVALIAGEGTGLTAFANGHNLILSFFTNTASIDGRLNTLETKTTAMGYTTLGGASTNFGSKVNLNANKITTTYTPLNSEDLCNKNYVDNTVNNFNTVNYYKRYVDDITGSDITGNGTLAKPFKTINYAIFNGGVYPLKLIISGVFNESIALYSSNSNIQIVSEDPLTQSYQTTINGTITTNGTFEKLTLCGFILNGGTGKCLDILDTGGSHTFTNIKFNSTNIQPITCSTTFQSNITFRDCSFESLGGQVNFPNQSSSSLLKLDNCGLININIGSNWSCYNSGNTWIRTLFSIGQFIQLPINLFIAVIQSQAQLNALTDDGFYLTNVGGLSGISGYSLYGAFIRMGGSNYMSLKFKELPPTVNVKNVSQDYDTWTKKKNSQGWQILENCLPLEGGTMTGNIALGVNKITSSFTASSNTDIPNKLYVDTADNLKLNISGGTMTGDLIAPTLYTNNKFININGMSVGTNDTASVYLGYNVAGGPSNYVNITGTSNFLLGQNAGFQLTTGSKNVGIGDGNAYSLITGSENTTIGDFSGILNVGSQNTYIGAQSQGTSGSNNTCIGYATNCSTYSNTTCLGNGAVANSSNQVFIGNSSVVSISANSNCNLGTASVPFKDIYISGEIYQHSSSYLTGSLYATSGATTLSAYGQLATGIITSVGNPTNSAVTQTGINAYTKIIKVNYTTTSVAAYQDSGAIGNSTFFRGSAGLYVGMGWKYTITFGIGDTASSICGMQIGFVASITTPTWSASVTPDNTVSWFGVGCNYSDSVLSFYNKGSLGTGSKISTSYSVTSPNTQFWNLTMINKSGSDEVVLILKEMTTNTSVIQNFTMNGTLSVSTATRLYPVFTRMFGSITATGGAQISFGAMTLTA